jgi:hypothetical protein
VRFQIVVNSAFSCLAEISDGPSTHMTVRIRPEKKLTVPGLQIHERTPFGNKECGLRRFLFRTSPYRVHVLDPNSIHRTVQHQPLPVRRLFRRLLPELDGQDPVRPFLRHGVRLSVQLSHRNRFRVDRCHLDFVFAGLARGRHVAQRTREHADGTGFAGEGLANCEARGFGVNQILMCSGF